MDPKDRLRRGGGRADEAEPNADDELLGATLDTLEGVRRSMEEVAMAIPRGSGGLTVLPLQGSRRGPLLSGPVVGPVVGSPLPPGGNQRRENLSSEPRAPPCSFLAKQRSKSIPILKIL